MATLGLPSTTSHGGSDSNISTDGTASAAAVATATATASTSSGLLAGGAECAAAAETQRTRAALEHLQQKILKVTEQIRVEQEARDDNVAEYLKLAHNADKQQASRIKQVFEKKNQKSAQTITHLHKKLEHYHKKLKEIEQVRVCFTRFDHQTGPNRGSNTALVGSADPLRRGFNIQYGTFGDFQEETAPSSGCI